MSMSVFPLWAEKEEKKELYRDLIEAVQNLDSYEVRSELYSFKSIPKEMQKKLLRIVDGILAQEAYKRNALKKSAYLHIITGGVITVLCLVYLFQNELTDFLRSCEKRRC